MEWMALETPPASSAASAAAGAGARPLALQDASAEQNMWLKVNEAMRVGPGVVFKAKLAVRSLGKGSVAAASRQALTAVILQAEELQADLQELSLQNSAGELAAQVDSADVLSRVKQHHGLLTELTKGEKSALLLKDK
jgi:hypothetical protein